MGVSITWSHISPDITTCLPVTIQSFSINVEYMGISVTWLHFHPGLTTCFPVMLQSFSMKRHLVTFLYWPYYLSSRYTSMFLNKV